MCHAGYTRAADGANPTTNTAPGANNSWSPVRSIPDTWEGLEWRTPHPVAGRRSERSTSKSHFPSTATDLFETTAQAITEHLGTTEANESIESVPSPPNVGAKHFPSAERRIKHVVPFRSAKERLIAPPPTPVDFSCDSPTPAEPVSDPGLDRAPDIAQPAMLTSWEQHLTSDDPTSIPHRSVLVSPERPPLSDTPDLAAPDAGPPDITSSPDPDPATDSNHDLPEPPREIDDLGGSDEGPAPEEEESGIILGEASSRIAQGHLRPLEDEGDRRSPPESSYCDEAQRSCRTAWEQLQESKLSDISLDISPPFDPGEEDREVARRKRDAKLGKTGVRTWRDRRGNQLAEGQLQDFRFGKLDIQSTDGTVRQISFAELSDDDACFLAEMWNFPGMCRFQDTEFQARNWHLLTMTWTASAVCHKPLYFEDVPFERYGHTSGPVRQTFLSGAHFFGDVLMLPYNVGLHSPFECQYTLGYYRPGSCAPRLRYALPISAKAIRYQTSSILGVSSFLP